MAESESGADKSEEPTSKRLEEARKKGQIARSRELSTLAVTFGGAAALLIFGAQMGQAMLGMMQGNFALPREVLLDDGSMARYLLRTGMEALLALQPFFIVMLIASIVGPVALGGWLFSSEALQPKFSRMNPWEGLKRMFSAKALIERNPACFSPALRRRAMTSHSVAASTISEIGDAGIRERPARATANRPMMKATPPPPSVSARRPAEWAMSRETV